MKTLTFLVPGPLYGYRQTTRYSLWLPRNAKYAQFKKNVLYLAMEVGWKGHVQALKEWPPLLSVAVRWRKGPRVDWKNIYGAIEDALFVEDRHVKPGAKSAVEWDTGIEEARVTLEY